GYAINGGSGGFYSCERSCTCAALPAVPPGLPGFFGRLHPDGDGFSVVGYEPEYGDLVRSTFTPVGEVLEPGREGLVTERSDLVLDGLPDSAPVVSGLYRGGLLDPGPDRGDRPATTVAAGALHA